MKPIQKLFLTSLILGASIPLKSQEPEKPKFEVKPYGFVLYEIIMDTYKSLDARDGELYFYPLKENLDKNGDDINEKLQLQMLSLSSRFGTRITGPDLFGAKASGMFEVDFFATQNDYARLMRIRHAIVNLKWEKTELLIGHYWHPAVVAEVLPGPVSFGAGTPFHALNRSPQIRLTHYLSETMRLSATALTQGYHKSTGPSDAQRNSGLPELLLQASFGNRKTFIAGATAGYKWLTPRLVTDSLYKTSETIGQYLFTGFIMGKIDATTVKAEVIYGENLTHLVMIGGYGQKTTTAPLDDNDFEYTSIKTLSTWLDVNHNLGKTSFGMFLGYSKLDGASDNYTSLEINKAKCHRNDDLNYIYRIAPRLNHKEENFTIGVEFMITAAIYGKEWDSKRKVKSSMDPVYNNRITLSAKYDF